MCKSYVGYISITSFFYSLMSWTWRGWNLEQILVGVFPIPFAHGLVKYSFCVFTNSDKVLQSFTKRVDD